LKAIAIDDEPPALKILEEFCSKVDAVDLEKTFTKPHEALKHLNKYPVDLLFLDIKMPSMSGIQFYKSITQNTSVIFTTAYSEYAVDGFNLSAIDYLLKPFTFERFAAAINKAREYYDLIHQKSDFAQRYFFIRADYKLIKITFGDILFVEGLDDYLKIHLENNKPIVARITMKAILEKLPGNEFVRVHRSYIVPLSRIESVKTKMISLANEEIPIGSSYEENFNRIFKERT